jgi:hypothetical protein
LNSKRVHDTALVRAFKLEAGAIISSVISAAAPVSMVWAHMATAIAVGDGG